MASPALFDSSLLRRGLFDEDFPTHSVFDPWFGVEDPPIVVTDRVLYGSSRSGPIYAGSGVSGPLLSGSSTAGPRYRGS